MSKIKRHRVKQENAASSSSNTRPPEEHDLAYFIHDRVELMHQVFSVLKSKELKQLAPECVRRLSTDDLQELCLEELLGISSKRLCAILDGAEPPSDSESSSQSPEHLETISLDSISSDEEILSLGSGKKKKHKHRHSKKKRKKRGDSAEAGESRASRAGLTVLELLELQARARAIRAQLHQEHTPAAPGSPPREASSDNEVEIKEEPAEVVEISSDEDKPNVAHLQKDLATSTSNSNETTTNKQDEPQTVTNRIKDLIITEPQSKPTRRIKLKRQKPTENVAKETTTKVVEKEPDNTEVIIGKSNDKDAANIDSSEQKNKSKKNKRKKKTKDNKGSDEDEITLQLSDTEKMDLLEDLDAKNLDNVSSSDSDSSDGQQNTEKSSDDIKTLDYIKQPDKKDVEMNDSNKNNDTTINITKKIDEENTEETNKSLVESNKIKGYVSNDNDGTVEINDLLIVVDKSIESNDNVTNSNGNEKHIEVNEKCDLPDKSLANDESNGHEKDNEQKPNVEISDRECSKVEVSDIQLEVVCISEEENKIKKKKKKEKKTKKDKSKLDFRESKDDNFYKDDKMEDSNYAIEITIDDDDDVYEFLEISDDSSCYEVEGVSVLSKEPTAEEIEAFSARMDEIEIDSDDRVLTNEKEEVSETTDVENVSWKDRYLGSKKVKRVLTTSNILNAIRKKNIELKKKLEESKKAEKVERGNEQNKIEEDIEEEKKSTVEDGSVDQYETLQGSTKYVDPVKEKEVSDNEKNVGEEIEGNETVTKEMKKDAKMLLKMYKRLLKYNDVSKQKDPSKKKKKKQKKSKDKEKVK